MKRTFLAIMMAGSSVALLAQTTPATPPTPASPTTAPATASPATKTTNSTTDPVKNVTNGQPATYNGSPAYPPSTSWDAGTSPNWGWNSYGIWNNNASNSGTANNGAGTSAALTSGNAYNAYAGTAVSTLPYYVQTNFGRDYPNPGNRQYAWNQYGDWFSTHYTAKGRLTQYFYDQRGSGYSLSLPVIQTYVPEEIVDKALQKYGARLYSISTIKTADGSSAYQVGLIDRGWLHSDYLNEQGVSVVNVWRTEEMNLSSSTSNAALNDVNGSATQDNNSLTTDVSAYQDTTSTGKHKMKEKAKNSDSKSKHGKMKTKGRKSSIDSTMNPSGMKEQ